MRHALVAVLFLLAAVAPSPAASSAQAPPLGTVVVGADPLVAETVAAGAEGWNATGVVLFVVEPTGCGTGTVTVCVAPTQRPEAVAEWDYVIGALITVNPALLGMFTDAVAAHEFGHYLGLRWYPDGSVYHRTDYLSCMSDPRPTVASPDAVDLANLGFPDWVAPAQEPEPAQRSGGGVVVVALPDTGSGSAARKEA